MALGTMGQTGVVGRASEQAEGTPRLRGVITGQGLVFRT